MHAENYSNSDFPENLMAEFYQLPSSAVQNHRTNKTVPAIRYFPRKTGQCLNLHLHKAHQGTAPCCPICWGKKTLNKAGQLPAAQHWTALTGNWVWGTGTETGHNAPAQPLQPSCPFQQDQEQKSKHRARRVMATDPVKSCCVWCRSLGFPLNIPVGTI